MKRIVCSKCGQLSLPPGKGWLDQIMHEPADDVCFACGTPFAGGPAALEDRIAGLQAHFINYAGIGVFFAAVGGLAVLIPVRIFIDPGPAPAAILALIGAAIGGACGVAMARRNRQRGEILHRHPVE